MKVVGWRYSCRSCRHSMEGHALYMTCVHANVQTYTVHANAKPNRNART